MGLAKAVPPEWIKTASEAEAWALLLVLQEVVGIPRITTDCLTVVKMAEAGIGRATDSRCLLARTWGEITSMVGGDLSELAKALRWMPAHVTAVSFSNREDSRGNRIGPIDWRANQIADALAKQAAATCQTRVKAEQMIEAAEEAVEFYGAMLGRLAHLANNCPGTVTHADGTTKAILMRDSTSLNSHHSRRQRSRMRGDQQPSTENVSSGEAAQSASRQQGMALGNVAATPKPKPKAKPRGEKVQGLVFTPAGIRAWHREQARAERKAADKRRVNDIVVRCKTDPLKVPAADRLAAVRERVRRKELA